MLAELGDRLAVALLQLRGFRSRTIPTSVGGVHVLDAPGYGDGPPIVVLHGISASSVHFLGVLPALLRHSRRVIAPDMPGHGFSEVPAAGVNAETLRIGILESLDAVIDEPVVFCGNSLGGIGAIRFALARPDRVRALLLVSPGGAMMDDTVLAGFLDRFRLDDPGRAIEFVDRLYAVPPFYRSFLAPFVRQNFARPHIRALVDGVSRADLLLPDDLARLAMPIRMLWGKHDKLLPRENLAFFRAHLPAHAEIDEPDAFGHCPQLDRPGALIAAIVDYLAAHRS